jgi:hypothetical protein
VTTQKTTLRSCHWWVAGFSGSISEIIVGIYAQYRLRVFENRVLRRIFGPKRDEMTGDWRKLHNEERHNLCSSPNRMSKSRKMRWAEHVTRRGAKRNTYRICGKARRKETTRKTKT